MQKEMSTVLTVVLIYVINDIMDFNESVLKVGNVCNNWLRFCVISYKYLESCFNFGFHTVYDVMWFHLS